MSKLIGQVEHWLNPRFHLLVLFNRDSFAQFKQQRLSINICDSIKLNKISIWTKGIFWSSFLFFLRTGSFLLNFRFPILPEPGGRFADDVAKVIIGYFSSAHTYTLDNFQLGSSRIRNSSIRTSFSSVYSSPTSKSNRRFSWINRVSCKCDSLFRLSVWLSIKSFFLELEFFSSSEPYKFQLMHGFVSISFIVP